MLKKLIWFVFVLLFLAFPFRSEARDYKKDLEERIRIQSIIVIESLAAGIDPGLAIFIAAGESDFNYRAKSKISSASGVFQWLKGSFLSFCVKGYGLADEHSDVFDAAINIRCAVKTIADGGISHWLADPTARERLEKAGWVKNGQLTYAD